MTKYQIVLWGFWSMLLLNIILIAIFFFAKPPPPHLTSKSKGFKTKVATILHLDAEQKPKFDQLASGHNSELTKIDSLQSLYLELYFSALIGQQQSSDHSLLLEKVQKLEGEKVELTFQHFKDVKKILNPNQTQYFETFVKRAINVLLFNKKRKAN